MKITNIDLCDSNDKVVANLSFRDPSSSNPYIAKTIIGLDADEIISRFYGVSKVSNSKYYKLTLEKREIVLRIVLNPDFSMQSYSDLRDEIYKFISSSRTGKIRLNFNEGTSPVAYVSGFVTKLEAPHFTEMPEIQITMICEDPMLRGVKKVVAINSPTVKSSLKVTDPFSTAPHGFKFNVKFTAASPTFVLKDSATPEWSFTVTPLAGFVINDELYFSSEYSNKYLYMIKAGAKIHLADKIQSDSIWPILFPGDNIFKTADELFTWNYLEYYPAYWGV